VWAEMGLVGRVVPGGAVGPVGGVGLVRGAVGVRFLPNKSPQPTALSRCSARWIGPGTVSFGGGTLLGPGGGWAPGR